MRTAVGKLAPKNCENTLIALSSSRRQAPIKTPFTALKSTCHAVVGGSIDDRLDRRLVQPAGQRDRYSGQNIEMTRLPDSTVTGKDRTAAAEFRSAFSSHIHETATRVPGQVG
ncbi:MAG: hypothetical protein ACR2OW_04615 [Methyloligellaceae bacterium]